MSAGREERAGWKWLAPAAAALLAILLYVGTLWGTYVYDDEFICRDDERIQQPGRWVEYLRIPYFPAAPDPLWRPLTSLTYAMQWRLHGDRAWPLHAVNILLHAGVSALVARLAGRLSKKSAAAWIAGLLFAAHPVHVESVAYLVGRAETLCSLGIIGGLLLFAHHPLTMGRALWITGCFVFAVLSKEHGILLPAMLLAWFVGERLLGEHQAFSSPAERTAGLWLFVLLSFSTLGYISYRESIMHIFWERFFIRWTVNPLFRSEGLDRVLAPISVLGRNVGLLIFPARLSPDYGAAITDYRMRWSDRYFYAGVLATVGYATALVVAVRRRAAGAAICLCCLGIAYALISNFFYLIGIIMGERLLYLSSVFFVILLAMGLARLPRGVMIPLMAVALGFASVRTATYAWRWNDALRLFRLCRKENPTSIYLHVLEAEQWMQRGDLARAEEILAEGRRLGPDSQNVWAMSAQVARLRGRDGEAQQYAIRAFDLDLHPPHMPRNAANQVR